MGSRTKPDPNGPLMVIVDYPAGSTDEQVRQAIPSRAARFR
jgi:hypothetical protein